jgi:putative ABC transport system substrate-binding protein
MKRRDFIAGLCGAMAWPFAARAQQQPLPIVAFLGVAPASSSEGRIEAFRLGLRDLGFVAGNNMSIEFRFAEGPGQLREFAGDIVQLKPAVILTSGNAAALVAKSVTSTIPIVFSAADDPVRIGLVTSFNQPGGNVTGISMISGALGGKRLELLREIIPPTPLVAVLVNPDNPADASMRDEQAVGGATGQQFLRVTANSEQGLETAFARLVQERAGALIVGADAFFTASRDHITALAAHYRIPAIYPWREYPESGGLMSYGTSITVNYRQMGTYAGKILRGVKPGDLPVIQPTNFELVINLKTAKALGLDVPAKLLALADAVIE